MDRMYIPHLGIWLRRGDEVVLRKSRYFSAALLTTAKGVSVSRLAPIRSMYSCNFDGCLKQCDTKTMVRLGESTLPICLNLDLLRVEFWGAPPVKINKMGEI